MPVLTVFGGPNGSGKSSLIRQVEFEGLENLLEPDAIAKRIKPEFPSRPGFQPEGKFFVGRRSTFEARELRHRNHPGRQLDERCDSSGAGTILLTRLFYHLSG